MSHEFSEQSEKELVESANSGNTEAMEEIYRIHRSWAFSVASRLNNNRDDAADVMQETFIYFFNRFPGFELRSALRTYLYTVIKNKSIDLARKQKRMNISEDEILDRIPSKYETEYEKKAKLEELMEGLENEERRLLIMRYYDGLTNIEISEIMEISLGTIKSKIHRSISKLKKTIANILILLLNIPLLNGA